MNSFLLDAQWISRIADDGAKYARVTGTIPSGVIHVLDEPTAVRMQFQITGQSIECSEVELDGEGEPLFFGLELLGLMCADYAGG